MAIVTNIENDHLDHYGTVDKIISAFRTFLRQIPDDGLAILCADDAQLMTMRCEVSAKILTYGLSKEADIYVDKIVYSGTNSKCDVYVHREKVCTLELSIPGVHNIINALAVLALAYHLKQDLQQAAEALKYFKGVNRRFQIHFSDQEYVVVDDYAHHPTEIRATLKATKNATAKRVVAVFQPHRFTRTKQLYKDFGKAFADADVIIITEIYSAGEKPIAGVSARLIVDEIEKTGKRVIYSPDFNTVQEHILTIAKPGDMIITIGAGNIWQAGVQVAQHLENR
jgi:UDP-N-acetylmuramate--alanine ligase